MPSLLGSASIGDTISGSNFFRKLEKHLYDVSKNRGYLSKDVASKLSKIDAENSQTLSQSSPTNYSNYLSYQSALSYDKRARYVNGVEGARVTEQKIKEAQENGKRLKESLEKIA